MTFCVSTGVGTWTNWSTFEPDPDHSPDAGTGLLSPMAYTLQRGILLRRENPTYRYWAYVLALGLRRRNTVVGGKCALPSALLVTNGLLVICKSRTPSVSILRQRSVRWRRCSNRVTTMQLQQCGRSLYTEATKLKHILVPLQYCDSLLVSFITASTTHLF